jgi:hypothetical protein
MPGSLNLPGNRAKPNQTETFKELEALALRMDQAEHRPPSQHR